jgi:hypothetical protein
MFKPDRIYWLLRSFCREFLGHHGQIYLARVFCRSILGTSTPLAFLPGRETTCSIGGKLASGHCEPRPSAYSECMPLVEIALKTQMSTLTEYTAVNDFWKVFASRNPHRRLPITEPRKVFQPPNLIHPVGAYVLLCHSLLVARVASPQISGARVQGAILFSQSSESIKSMLHVVSYA